MATQPPQEIEEKMSEYENNESVEEIVKSAEQVEVERLTSDLEKANTRVDYYRDKFSELSRKIEQAKSELAEAIENEHLEADNDYVETLAEIFGWELTTEIEIEVEIKVQGTLTMPIGKTLRDFDNDDFSVDLTLNTHYNQGDWSFSQDSSDIEDVNEQ